MIKKEITYSGLPTSVSRVTYSRYRCEKTLESRLECYTSLCPLNTSAPWSRVRAHQSLVRIPLMVEIIWWTGLAPLEFEFKGRSQIYLDWVDFQTIVLNTSAPWSGECPFTVA